MNGDSAGKGLSLWGEVVLMPNGKGESSQGKKRGRDLVSSLLRLVPLVKLILEIFELALKYFWKNR